MIMASDLESHAYMLSNVDFVGVGLLWVWVFFFYIISNGSLNNSLN